MNKAIERTIKSTQEQAVAAWITFLNQVRLDTLIENLKRQDINLKEALAELAELKAFIGNPAHILGSDSSKHGEIAEHMQVNISNARRLIQGLFKEYTFTGVGRTAPEDYLKNGQAVQSKFYNGLKNTFFNSHGVADHLDTYHDFIKNGGSYDIPKDQYHQMVELLNKLHDNPSQLSKSEFRLAKRLDEFIKANNLKLGKDINPSATDYSEVQRNVANDTVGKEEANIKKTNDKLREKIHEKSKPSLDEGLKAAGVSAALEGGVAFCMAFAKKRKEKKVLEFTAEDWKTIGLDTGKGTFKGGIRGGTIYIMSNFTATPANVASAYVTAAFGVTEQIQALKAGEITQEDFVINCETVCLDVTVSAIASLAGQVVIPVPVLGAVIGNVAGEFIYELCKKQGTKKSQQIIQNYQKEMAKLNRQLDIQLLQVIIDIKKALKRFNDLERFAFDLDSNVAFDGSIKLAVEVGVPSSKILKTKRQIDSFFID